MKVSPEINRLWNQSSELPSSSTYCRAHSPTDMKEIPIAERKEIYESKSHRVRPSRQGWDQMGLDEFKIVRTPRGTIRFQLMNSCIPRGLLWRFHIVRCMPPEAERSGPYANDVWYCVKRVA